MKSPTNSEHVSEIDTLGWTFAAFVIVIAALGALLAYNGNHELMANTPQSSMTAISLR
jgi:hypothetical protein